MKILVLAALEKEISVLNNLINTETKDGVCFAKINNNEIYTAITGVGILNAFSMTNLLIEKLHPDFVINIGTAGGHTLEVNDGDVVVCDEAIYHGGYIMTNNPTSTWDAIEETNLVIKGDEKLSKLFDEITADTTIRHGRTLSGDFFTRDVEVIKALNNKYHHLCEDMETIAIYKACKDKNTPCIAYRIISNNELRGTLYQDDVLKVNKKLQTIIFEFLNYLP
jgi:adenosylhomocysteine nucleosidase